MFLVESEPNILLLTSNTTISNFCFYFFSSNFENNYWSREAEGCNFQCLGRGTDLHNGIADVLCTGGVYP